MLERERALPIMALARQFTCATRWNGLELYWIDQRRNGRRTSAFQMYTAPLHLRDLLACAEKR